MLIIEGPDNSGKTTLCTDLRKRLGIPVVHSERPNPAWGAERILAHSNHQLLPKRIIRDRIYVISEYVYGRVIRGGSALRGLHADALMDLYQRPYLIIYCRPDDRAILDSQGREQMEGVLDKHQAIIQEYDKLMGEVALNCKVVRYDYQSDRVDDLVITCSKYLQEFQSQLASAAFMCLYRSGA